MKKRDAIAEQGLASTLRKCIEGDIALQFPKIESIGQGADAVQIINPPVQIKFSRAVEGRPDLRLAHAMPFDRALIESNDKEFAVCLAVALHTFLEYERAALSELHRRDVTGSITGGGNGAKKIIITDEQ